MSDITQIKRSLTADYVRSVLDYDQWTGAFTWKYRDGGYPQWNGRFAGKLAGYKTPLGYVAIRLKGKLYLAHCLAWLYMAGEWCPVDIDHIDSDGTNNAWSNLRAATKSQNLQNRGKNKNNTSGFKGVWFSREKGKWCAEIGWMGQRKKLGLFGSPEEAARAYEAAAISLHGDFARVS